MTRIGLLNFAALVLTLGLGALASDLGRPAIEGIASVRQVETQAPAEDTPTVVTDARGREVRAGDYARIVSGSTIADQVLLELVAPTRIVAVTSRIQRQGPDAWRYQGFEGLDDRGEVEAVLALRPDIVFVSGFADPRKVQTLRDAGVRVFNLGPMQGWPTLRQNVLDIATIVNERARGEAFLERYEARLAAVAADIPAERRVEGIYVGVHGGRIYGGTVGTSYADVLRIAGLVDVAEPAGYTGWPAYTSEQLLALDPAWIITQTGREQALCETAGLDRLRACRDGHVRGVDAVVLTDPGLSLLRAAEAVRIGVHGPRE